MNKLSQPGSLLQFFSFTDGVGPILSAPLFWRKRCLFEVLRKCACRRGSSCIPISTDFSWCLDPFFFPILSVTGHLPLVSSTAFSPCQACLPQHTIPLDKLITFFRFRYILGFFNGSAFVQYFYIPKSRCRTLNKLNQTPPIQPKNHQHFFKSFWLPNRVLTTLGLGPCDSLATNQVVCCLDLRQLQWIEGDRRTQCRGSLRVSFGCCIMGR